MIKSCLRKESVFVGAFQDLSKNPEKIETVSQYFIEMICTYKSYIERDSSKISSMWLAYSLEKAVLIFIQDVEKNFGLSSMESLQSFPPLNDLMPHLKTLPKYDTDYNQWFSSLGCALNACKVTVPFSLPRHWISNGKYF